MQYIIEAIYKLTENVKMNYSSYLLLLGVAFVLSFIYMSFGFTYLILGVGVTLIGASFIHELNTFKKK